MNADEGASLRGKRVGGGIALSREQVEQIAEQLQVKLRSRQAKRDREPGQDEPEN